MAAIPEDWGSGNSNLNPKNSTTARPSLAQAVRDVADDLAALRAAMVGVTAKLDLDGTVTDTDYASLHDPAALLTTKV